VPDSTSFNRTQSQTIAEPTVAYISVSGSIKITRALCWRENRSKQHGGRRGGNFAESKFISSVTLQNRLQNLRHRHRYIQFLPDFFPAVSLFVFVVEIFTVTVVDALISRNFLYKFLVTNLTLFNASHVYNK